MITLSYIGPSPNKEKCFLCVHYKDTRGDEWVGFTPSKRRY